MSVFRSVPLRAVAALLALAAGTLGGGCMHPGRADPARTGPFYTPTNFQADPSLGGVRRIVVLPVWSGQVAPPETAAEIDGIVLLALQQQKRFEITPVSRAWMHGKFRVESIASSAALPHDLLAKLRKEFAAEAVLFVDLTVYQAYRPLGVGFRSKLASIDGTRLIWTFDDLFQSDHAQVANAARNYFLEADTQLPVDMTHGVLHSPSRFTAYASAAMFATLPPVVAPVVAASRKR